MPYTIRDSPDIVARIQSDLDVVVQATRKADPRLRALVLTGGFARGEGSVAHGQPQNDYDFVALRRLGRAKTPYPVLQEQLEARLGLHVDLAPVGAWRLPFVARSIFWYETALRGRTLWGEELLHRIRIQDATKLDAKEGLRLLVNRAAGLLFVRDSDNARERRIQASKGLLAVVDAHLLAHGRFAPSQRERWTQWQQLQAAPSGALVPWTEWAYQFKVDPDHAPPRDHEEAWNVAAHAIIQTVPTALQHAGLASLEEYARRDGLLGHLAYWRRSAHVPGAKRFVLNPTGRVRVATLRMLEAVLSGDPSYEAGRRWLGRVTRRADDPMRALEALRRATLQ